MVKKYKHILFDLDHTLWDFDKNSEEVLHRLYRRYNFNKLKLFTAGQFVMKFHAVNRRLWDLYNGGKITKDNIRAERFPAVFSELACPEDLIPSGISEEYLKLCPLQRHVLPFTHDALAYLQKKYALHIVTNGFEDVQHIKLKSAGLADFFNEIVTSEVCGYKKPDKKIFEYVLDKIGAEAADCIMVGDNLETDIRGAREAQIDTVFYNPLGYSHAENATYEINCLSDLPKML